MDSHTGSGEISSASDISTLLLDSVLQLVVRYPALLHRLSAADQSIDIYFYHEEAATECADALEQVGIHGQLPPEYPRAVRLPLEPALWMIEVLDDFLLQLDRRCQKNPSPWISGEKPSGSEPGFTDKITP